MGTGIIKFTRRKYEFLQLYFSKETNHLKKEVHVKKKWFGNDYGGFYVATEFVKENSIIYSIGIGEDISFDEQLIKKYNCEVFGFDFTPKSIKWIQNNSISEKFHFKTFGIGTKTGKTTFFFPKNSELVSGSVIKHNNINPESGVEVEIKTLEDIMANLNHKKVDILKMDIEGSEYEVLENILNSKVEIGQILVEFHDRFFEDGKQKCMDVLKKIKNHNFLIFGISETYDEVSFINKNLIK